MARGRKKGTTKTGGRKKGTPNKMTVCAREAFEHAFQGLDGADGLTEWAKDNPTEFYKLYARLIPLEVVGDFQPVMVTIVDPCREKSGV